MRKSTLVALSWALEDECCARAERPVLFGAFQRRQYWEDAADRWAELARVARSTTVFADFDTVSATAPGEPTLVPLAADALMRREWVLVCDSPTHPATLAAWELPGQLGVPERDRLFECVWSIDPRVVRTAATVCAALALEAGMDGAAVLVRDLDTEPDQGAIDGPAAMSLFSRVVEYVDRLG